MRSAGASGEAKVSIARRRQQFVTEFDDVFAACDQYFCGGSRANSTAIPQQQADLGRPFEVLMRSG
jgi:hypothetical protein